MVASIRLKTSLDGLPRIQSQLRGLSSKVRKKSIGKATIAAAKVILAEVKRTVPTVTRMLLRSLTLATKQRVNFTVCRVGQKKSIRRKFKQVMKNITASNINRSGYAAPIHLVENSTRPHVIKPKNTKRLRWFGVSGTTKGGKVKRSVTFAKSVNHPGTSASGFLRRAGIRSGVRSRAAFVSVLQSEIKINSVSGGA
jgi:hypothetical protein